MLAYSRTFAINSQFSKFDLVVVDVTKDKIWIKGKRLFAAIGKEEVVEVRIFSHISSYSSYSQISYYLNQKLASAYFAAEILTWLEGKVF